MCCLGYRGVDVLGVWHQSLHNIITPLVIVQGDVPAFVRCISVSTLNDTAEQEGDTDANHTPRVPPRATSSQL